MPELLKNKSSTFEVNNDFELKVPIKDIDWLNFIKKNNGGCFYNNSLHLFGFSNYNLFHNINYRNEIMANNYGNISKDLMFFAEDLFGNSYAFETSKIVLFNIESGQKETISSGFSDWLKILNTDLDYLTGVSFTEEINNENKKALAQSKRLCPKYPFVLGGQYSIENLVLKDYIENIQFSSSIAKQIYNLPEGAKVKININE